MASILYSSLDEYHAYKEISTALASLTNADKQNILRDLRAASRRVDRYCHRSFYPWVGAHSYDFEDVWEIRFHPHDLLEIDTLTTGGTDLTSVASSEYDLLTGDAYDLYPKSRLLIHTDSGTTLDIGPRYEQSNAVTGWWGYHEDWDNAFLSSLDTVQDAPLSAAATSLTVADADAADENGVTPRFQVGQLLRIEDELLYVSAINTTTNVLTVARGQSGSTAASHVATTAINIYQAMADVKEATLIIASYMLALPQAPFGTTQTLEAKYQMRLSIPETAVELLEPFKRSPAAVRRRAKRGAAAGRLYPGGVDPWGKR
jgi:hypothetical protein